MRGTLGQILDHTVPGTVMLLVSVLLILGDVQLDLELKVASQPLQQHDRKTVATADVVRPVLVLDLVVEILEDFVELILVFCPNSKAGDVGQARPHTLLLHHERFDDDGHNAQRPFAFLSWTGNGVPGPDDGRYLKAFVAKVSDHLPVLAALFRAHQVENFEVVDACSNSFVVERQVSE